MYFFISSSSFIISSLHHTSHITHHTFSTFTPPMWNFIRKCFKSFFFCCCSSKQIVFGDLKGDSVKIVLIGNFVFTNPCAAPQEVPMWNLKAPSSWWQILYWHPSKWNNKFPEVCFLLSFPPNSHFWLLYFLACCWALYSNGWPDLHTPCTVQFAWVTQSNKGGKTEEWGRYWSWHWMAQDGQVDVMVVAILCS